MADNENDGATETTGGADAASSTPTPAVNPGGVGVVLLGAYLFVMLIGGFYFMSVLMLAKPVCEEGSKSNPCPTSTPTPTPTPDGNTNAANSTGSANNSAANNAPPANNSNTSVNSNANVPGRGAQNSNSAPKSNTNSGVAPNQSANTEKSNSTTKPPETPAPPNMTIPKVVSVQYFWSKPNELTGDGYLFFIVLLAGIVGGVTRCIFSFFKHLGRGDFAFVWIWYYIFLPFGGSALSLVMYFVIRGGFYTSSVGKDLALNVFSFAALGALTGLFSPNAMKKLKTVAESLLEKTDPPVSSKNGNK